MEPQDWYFGLPLITRSWLTVTVAAALASKLGMVHMGVMLFEPSRIWSRFEVWRLITPFFVFGKVDFSWLFNIMIL